MWCRDEPSEAGRGTFQIHKITAKRLCSYQQTWDLHTSRSRDGHGAMNSQVFHLIFNLYGTPDHLKHRPLYLGPPDRDRCPRRVGTGDEVGPGAFGVRVFVFLFLALPGLGPPC